MASVARREEKGSDVNVASHLLIDALEGSIGAALVVTNDSDIAFALDRVRSMIPVGLVNPTTKPLAGRLGASAETGVGRHWWHRLTAEDLFRSQLPEAIARGIHKPANW
jgi:hypothetical protein